MDTATPSLLSKRTSARILPSRVQLLARSRLTLRIPGTSTTNFLFLFAGAANNQASRLLSTLSLRPGGGDGGEQREGGRGAGGGGEKLHALTSPTVYMCIRRRKSNPARERPPSRVPNQPPLAPLPPLIFPPSDAQVMEECPCLRSGSSTSPPTAPATTPKRPRGSASASLRCVHAQLPNPAPSASFPPLPFSLSTRV